MTAHCTFGLPRYQCICKKPSEGITSVQCLDKRLWLYLLTAVMKPIADLCCMLQQSVRPQHHLARTHQQQCDVMCFIRTVVGDDFEYVRLA